MLRTNSLSNETNNIKAQHTEANRVNDDNSNRITESLARLADRLANISAKLGRIESDLTYHSNMVEGDMANISIKTGRVESYLAYHSNMIAGDMANFSIKIGRVEGDLAKLSSRIENVEVSRKEIAVSYLQKPFLCVIKKTLSMNIEKKNVKNLVAWQSQHAKKCQKRKMKTKKLSWRLINKTRQQSKNRIK